ncbi:MAG: serine/threonine protein kinase [Gemmataceae bacterium]
MVGQVVLGKYRVVRLLDEGGMSQIYLARHEDPPADVVVKVLKDSLKNQTKAVEHFRREIFIMTRFQHPYSVAVYDALPRGEPGPLMVMEYLRGADLAAVLHHEKRLSADRTGRILGQLCLVLQAAHDQGIVHRDLKPGNVMVLNSGMMSESIRLMDYGLAKMTSMLYLSPEDVVDFNLPPASGTPEYISPEMVRGMDMDRRCDLYSVGVMLYEMLAGRRPFVHSSVEQLMVAHAREIPPTFAEIGCRGVVPAAIEAVVRSCLHKHPQERPGSALELAKAYEKALGRRILPMAPARSSPLQSKSAPSSTPEAPMGRAPGPPASSGGNTYRKAMEVNMPETMAMVKLRGFIFDLKGEIVESVPGFIRVKLEEEAVAKKKEGVFGWLPTAKTSGKPGETGEVTNVELYMERRNPGQPNRLTITLIMTPAKGLASNPWRERCDKIGNDLKAYLMGQ